MSKRKSPWLKGALGAVVSLAIYVVTLGVFLSLALLIVSMEEGGANLSDFSIPLTMAVVLLSQGAGFEAGSIVLTIIPLLLTGLLIWLIATLVRRTSTDPKAYVSGLVVWVVVCWVFSQNVSVVLIDSGWLIALKTAIVYSIGFVIAALPGSALVKRCKNVLTERVPARIRLTAKLAVMPALAILCAYVTVGLIVVIVWVIQNHDGMMHLFHLSAMQTGSRIITTICTLAWLPNLCVWALSWLFGAGFSIGDLAVFTLWTGRASGLPPVPIFGIFPDAVADERLRMVFLALPLVVGLLTGLVLMLSKHFFAVSAGKSDVQMPAGEMVAQFVHPLLAFVVDAIVMTLLLYAMFWLSDGALGRQRLKHVGVDVIQSTQAVARPTSIGLFASWLIGVILIALVLAIRVIVRQVRLRRAAAPAAGVRSTTASAIFADAQVKKTDAETDGGTVAAATTDSDNDADSATASENGNSRIGTNSAAEGFDKVKTGRIGKTAHGKIADGTTIGSHER